MGCARASGRERHFAFADLVDEHGADSRFLTSFEIRFDFPGTLAVLSCWRCFIYKKDHVKTVRSCGTEICVGGRFVVDRPDHAHWMEGMQPFRDDTCVGSGSEIDRKKSQSRGGESGIHGIRRRRPYSEIAKVLALRYTARSE